MCWRVVKVRLIEKGIRLGNYQAIDPRFTSEHIEVAFVVDSILFDMQFRDIPIPSQGKYLNNLMEHVKVIVLNLYVAYLNNPEHYVGYLRRLGSYERYKYFQDFQFSYHNVKKVTDFLKDHGYIEQHKGYPSSDNYEGQIAKIRATVKLIKLIERKQFTPDMIKLDTSYDEV